MLSEKSGIKPFSGIEGARSSFVFFPSCSSLGTNEGPIRERFDDPEVETVESDEDDGCDGWPSRPWVGDCCGTFDAEADLFSTRNEGVALKAYGAIGAEVPL